MYRCVYTCLHVETPLNKWKMDTWDPNRRKAFTQVRCLAAQATGFGSAAVEACAGGPGVPVAGGSMPFKGLLSSEAKVPVMGLWVDIRQV